jgi:DNA polymerase III delta subunit
MPGPLTPAQVKAQIARGDLEPLYLVTGDDEAEMDLLAAALSDSVEEDLRAFNVQRFYGTEAETRLAAVLDAAGEFPMLAARRVVLLMQAQLVLAGKKGRPADAGEGDGDERAEAAPPGSGKVSDLDLLKRYAERPFTHAVVALFGRGLGRQFGALAKRAVVVKCETPVDTRELAGLEREFGVRFDGGARALVVERAAGDPVKLRAAVERASLYAPGQATITREEVEAIVSKPAAKGEWTLSNAVGDRRTAAALTELRLLLAEGAFPYMILGQLRAVVERSVASRDLPEALDAVLRADLALKTSSGDPQVVLERLVVEVCALGRD